MENQIKKDSLETLSSELTADLLNVTRNKPKSKKKKDRGGGANNCGGGDLMASGLLMGPQGATKAMKVQLTAKEKAAAAATVPPGHHPLPTVAPVRIHCSYCNVYFSTKTELQTHCRGQDHQTTIMSDEGRDWTHRPPPRGLSADEYCLCSTYKDTHNCRLGDQCVGAHSDAELVEWQERFEYRSMKLERAKEKHLHGASYADQLLERLSQAQHQDSLISEKTTGIISGMSDEANVRISQKPSSHEWVINMCPPSPLRVVSLLHDAHRTHFAVSEVKQIDSRQGLHRSYEPENNQEWISSDADSLMPHDHHSLEYKITITFKTAIYGTFRQAVILDYGTEPVLMQRLCVDVIPLEDLSVLEETKSTILTRSERWCEENSQILPFEPKPHELSTHDKSLLAAYPAPTNENFVLTQTSMEKFPTKNNYNSRLHDLLHIEELAQFDLMSRFNIKTTLHITSSYLLLPSTASTAKYSRPGELFGKLEVSADISEDSIHGRLVLSNCNTILVATVPEDSENGEVKGSKPKRIIHEVLIEDKTKKDIYLRFPETAVHALNLTDDEEVTVEVQFQLNRLPLCEMHAALDRLPSMDMIFPNVSSELTIPWNTKKQWGDTLDNKLNPKQREALLAITAPAGLILPPILIIGPYGTGKTYTLAQGIKQILLQPNTRILICTHSNSAADLYIKDYLHPYVLSGHEEAKPLRIYYRNRWVTTVHSDVQKYCLIEMEAGVRKFVMPTEEEVLSYRVIVATLNTSRQLVSLNMDKGAFTHILVDEAAQAMECEALTPLALTKPGTRLVLAGDYMQLSPEVFSPFCDERGLGMSLLERLYDLYPVDSPCKIMLVENYRSHSAIIKYTSDLFYEGRLIASGKQTCHPKFHPLTFFTARGEDFQDPNSTAFHNNSEVYEICEQVGEIIKYWPKKEWGPIGEGSIGVVTPYADQMVRIRAELRKRKLYKINVERVLNVQGKQFRVIILSTVRTRHTCKAGDEGLDFGFLSNAKLLTTAITRAQSLVAVVGDPVSLCSVGKCRKLWEKFLQLCSEAGSLYGITWSALRGQLDGVELKKTYVLNPLAPEFIPRYLYLTPLTHLSVVPTMPPYVNVYPPYSSYMPTYHIHSNLSMLGHHPVPYLPPSQLPPQAQLPPPTQLPPTQLPPTQLPPNQLPPQWPSVPFGSGKAPPPIVRPAGGRIGQPLIASHPLQPAGAVASSAQSPFIETPSHGHNPNHNHSHDFRLPGPHPNVYQQPIFPYASNAPPTIHQTSIQQATTLQANSISPHHLQTIRHQTDLEPFTRNNAFISALPGNYPHLKQVASPNIVHQQPSIGFKNITETQFTRTLSLPPPPPPPPIGHTTSQSEGEKNYQFLNNVHFPERNHLPNPSAVSSIMSQSLRSRADTESPLSSHSRESSHSSNSDGRASLRPQMPSIPASSVHLDQHNLQQPVITSFVQSKNSSAIQNPLQQIHQHHRPHSFSSYQQNGILEESSLPGPDVVRIIDDLISDRSPTKTPNDWGAGPLGSECNDIRLINNSYRNAHQSSVEEPWTVVSKTELQQQQQSHRKYLALSDNRMPQPSLTWLGATPPNIPNIGKIVTVQEVEASFHKQKSHSINIPPGSASSSSDITAGLPSFFLNEDEEEETVTNTRESDNMLRDARGRDVPPPPGFGGINRLVDPMTQLELRDVDSVGHRTPSIPLYLRRGSREAAASRSSLSPQTLQNHSSQMMQNLGGLNSNSSGVINSSMWNNSSTHLNHSSSVSPDDTGFKSLSILNSGLRSIGTGFGQLSQSPNSKTYASALRSSLQPSELDRNEEPNFLLKDLTDNKRYCTSNNHLYQYFP